MKLWDKGYQADQLIEAFTAGQDRELDLLLAEVDLMGSKAHADMLAAVGLISQEHNQQLQDALDALLEKAKKGELRITNGVEDIHSQVEILLTEQLGEVGKKIHLARSRNDQVLVDLRLFLRAQLDEIGIMVGELIQELLKMGSLHKDDLMPGHTHMQMAMVSSFGMWFGGFAEAFTDDLEYLFAVRNLINRNPLGTAAGYGSSMPIDRDLTTKSLEFKGVCISPINAQLGRGKTEYVVANALATTALTMSKMAMDICLFSSQEYGYVTLPDPFTTGSSIMPHKKNPDVFELIRARSNRLINLPTEIGQVIGNLPSGYHRDFQVLKESLFPALISMKDMLRLLIYCLPDLKINKIDMLDPAFAPLYSVELVNQYVLEGMSFREAYRRVALDLKENRYNPPKTLNHVHLGSLGNLGLDRIERRCQNLLKTKRANESSDF